MEMRKTTIRTSPEREGAGHEARDAGNLLIGGFLGPTIAATEPNTGPNGCHMGNLGGDRYGTVIDDVPASIKDRLGLRAKSGLGRIHQESVERITHLSEEGEGR